MTKEYKHHGELIAIIGDMNDIPRGRSFYENGKCPLEWGTFWYNYGEKAQAHIHKVRKRIPEHKTIEFLYVHQGKVKLHLYTNDKELIDDVMLRSGNFACLYSGGHSFEILKANTKMVEIKNGAFVGAEEDKEKF